MTEEGAEFLTHLTSAIDGHAGEHARQTTYLPVAVGRDRLPTGVETLRTVSVQLEQADREQLHHFAGVVFVREGVRDRIRPTIVQV